MMAASLDLSLVMALRAAGVMVLVTTCFAPLLPRVAHSQVLPKNLSSTSVGRTCPAGMLSVPPGRVTGHAGPETVTGFCIGRTGVTVREYRQCVAAGGCTAPSGATPFCNYGDASKAGHPVNCVSYAQASGYCGWQ